MTKISNFSNLIELPWQHPVHYGNFYMFSCRLSCCLSINISENFDFSQNLRPNVGLIDPSPLPLIPLQSFINICLLYMCWGEACDHCRPFLRHFECCGLPDLFSSPERKSHRWTYSDVHRLWFTMLKLLLHYHLANQSQILCGSHLGRWNESLFEASGSHVQDGKNGKACMVKTLQESSSPDPVGQSPWNLVMKYWGLQSIIVCSNDDPWLTLFYSSYQVKFGTKTLVLGKSENNAIAAYELKVGM